jgi:threonine/homoserine/homoserine lactone efflux protein
MVLMAMFGGFALLHHGPDMHIVVNDGSSSSAAATSANWLGAGIGLFVAGVVCVVVLPLVLLLRALLLLIVGGVMAAVSPACWAWARCWARR